MRNLKLEDLELRVILPQDLPPGAVVQVCIESPFDDIYEEDDGLDELGKELRSILPDHVKIIMTEGVELRVVKPPQIKSHRATEKSPYQPRTLYNK